MVLRSGKSSNLILKNRERRTRRKQEKQHTTDGEERGAGDTGETGEIAEGGGRGERQGRKGEAKLRDALRQVVRAKKKLSRGIVSAKNRPRLTFILRAKLS